MDNVSLSIEDLSNIRDVIDLACTRGAYRGDEMFQIGSLYNKLDTFIQAVTLQGQMSAHEPNPEGEPK